jgi:hypothetical protein
VEPGLRIYNLHAVLDRLLGGRILLWLYHIIIILYHCYVSNIVLKIQAKYFEKIVDIQKTHRRGILIRGKWEKEYEENKGKFRNTVFPGP